MKRFIIILTLVMTSVVCNAQTVTWVQPTTGNQPRLSSIKSRRCKHIQRPPITSQATDT